jgi:hypothetical protein
MYRYCISLLNEYYYIQYKNTAITNYLVFAAAYPFSIQEFLFVFIVKLE